MHVAEKETQIHRACRRLRCCTGTEAEGRDGIEHDVVQRSRLCQVLAANLG